MSRAVIIFVLLMLLSIIGGGVAGHLSAITPAKTVDVITVDKQLSDQIDKADAPKSDAPQELVEELPDRAVDVAEDYGPDWPVCRDMSNDPQLRITACSRLLTDAPLSQQHRSWTYNNRATGYDGLKRYDLAVQDYKRALILDSSNHAPYLNLGEIAMVSGRPREALILADKAIDRKQDYTSAYCLKARALRLLGKLDAAWATLDKIPATDMAETCVLRQRGEIAKLRGDTDQAIQFFLKAEADPIAASRTQCRAGELLYAQGRLEEAYQAYAKGVELNPENKCAALNKGLLVYQVRPFEEAVAVLDDAFARHPDLLELQCYKGVALERNQQSQAALELYDKILTAHPNESCSMRHRAFLFFQMGESDESLAAYATALKVAPRDAMIWEGRGQVNFLLGNIEQALEDFNVALKLNPNAIEPLRMRGEIFFYTGLYEPAAQDFTRLESLRPDRRDVGRFLAEVNLATGHPDETIQRCDLLIAAGKEDDTGDRCRILLARAYLQRNEASKAIQILSAGAAEEKPDSGVNLYLTAIYLAGGDRDHAAQSLARYRKAEPDNLYGMLWAALMARDSNSYSDEIVEAANQLDIWPLPLLRYAMGQIDEAEVTELAAVPDYRLSTFRAAEADFFIGLKLLLAGDTEAAGRHFHRLQSVEPVYLHPRDYPALYKHANSLELTVANWLHHR